MAEAATGLYKETRIVMKDICTTCASGEPVVRVEQALEPVSTDDVITSSSFSWVECKIMSRVRELNGR